MSREKIPYDYLFSLNDSRFLRLSEGTVHTRLNRLIKKNGVIDTDVSLRLDVIRHRYDWGTGLDEDQGPGENELGK